VGWWTDLPTLSPASSAETMSLHGASYLYRSNQVDSLKQGLRKGDKGKKMPSTPHPVSSAPALAAETPQPPHLEGAAAAPAVVARQGGAEEQVSAAGPDGAASGAQSNPQGDDAAGAPPQSDVTEAPAWTEYDEQDEDGQHVQAQQEQRRARSRSQTVYGSDRQGGLVTAMQAIKRSASSNDAGRFEAGDLLTPLEERGGSASFSSSADGISVGDIPTSEEMPSQESDAPPQEEEEEPEDEHPRHGCYASAEEVIAANVVRMEFMKDNILFQRDERTGSDLLKQNEKHALEEGLFLPEGRLSEVATPEPMSPPVGMGSAASAAEELEDDEDHTDDFVIGDVTRLTQSVVKAGRRIQIIILGERGSGKTALARLWAAREGQTDGFLMSDIGMDYALKPIAIHGKHRKEPEGFQVQIWDVSSALQEEGDPCLVDAYISSAKAVVIVCDASTVTSPKSLQPWFDRVKRLNKSSLTEVCLVVNKIDTVSDDKLHTIASTSTAMPQLKALRDLAKSNKASISLTSATTGENVFSTFNDLIIGIQKRRASRGKKEGGLLRFPKMPPKLRAVGKLLLFSNKKDKV